MTQEQEKLKEERIAETVGGGTVVVTVTGHKEVTDVGTKEEVVDPDNIEMLQDLVLAATNEAVNKADELIQERLGKHTRDLNIPGVWSWVHYPESIPKLTDSFMKLPGIGSKTVQRLAFHTLGMRGDNTVQFAKTLIDVKRESIYYNVCSHITENDPCYIYEDKRRDRSVTCVMEDGKDAIAMEKVGEYEGLYHILHGSISSMDGIGPEDINIPLLIERLKNDEVSELILAMNPNLEGKSTTMYISRLVKPVGIRVTRLAQGLSVGDDLEYADEAALSKAIAGRTEM